MTAAARPAPAAGPMKDPEEYEMCWTQALMRDVAQEERAGLGLGAADPFDPYALAKEHGIDVYTLSGLHEFGLGSEVLSHFTVRDSSAWSAALLPLGMPGSLSRTSRTAWSAAGRTSRTSLAITCWSIPSTA